MLMRRSAVIAFTLVVFLGCGDKGPGPGVGVNSENQNNDPEEDMGHGSIFPDVNVINNSSPDAQQNNNMPDLGPPDTGTDMAMAQDMGPDLPPDMGMDMNMTMNCPRTNVGYGQPCGCNQECTSGTCVDATVTSDGFCSTTCTARADCPTGDTCVTDRFGTSVCRQDDTGANCAQAGQPMPQMCSTGHCVEAGSNFPLDYFCSVPCSDSSECQTGHACSPVRCQFTLDGYRCIPTIIASRAPNTPQVLATYPESAKLCVKVGEANPCVNVSSDEQACAGSMCDQSPIGRCTAQCVTTADCPAGGCVDYDLSDGSLPIRVCDL